MVRVSVLAVWGCDGAHTTKQAIKAVLGVAPPASFILCFPHDVGVNKYVRLCANTHAKGMYPDILATVPSKDLANILKLHGTSC